MFSNTNDLDYNLIWGSPGGDQSYFSDTSPSSFSLASFEFHQHHHQQLYQAKLGMSNLKLDIDHHHNTVPMTTTTTISTINNNNSSSPIENVLPMWTTTMPSSLGVSTFSNYHVAQENGQRIFGPPLDWIGGHSPPERAAEVFVGKIPRDCFEDELIPLFERAGRIYKMRLMIDFCGKNRGYGFVQYFTKAEAEIAINMLNGYKVRKNWQIGVMMSKNNNRLFFGNLPNNINRHEMEAEISKYTSGVRSVIYYGGQHRTNGFGFVEYENHKQTALARRKFFPGSIQLFGRQPKVDWAKSNDGFTFS